jgi:hypothetical protein
VVVAVGAVTVSVFVVAVTVAVCVGVVAVSVLVMVLVTEVAVVLVSEVAVVSVSEATGAVSVAVVVVGSVPDSGCDGVVVVSVRLVSVPVLGCVSPVPVVGCVSPVPVVGCVSPVPVPVVGVVRLVIWLFMLLATLCPVPEPHPAADAARTPTSATVSGSERREALDRIGGGYRRIGWTRRVRGHRAAG